MLITFSEVTRGQSMIMGGCMRGREIYSFMEYINRGLFVYDELDGDRWVVA